MFPAERAGSGRNLHCIEEHLGNDPGVLGIIAHGHQAYAFDEYDLGGVPVCGDIFFDCLLRFLDIGIFQPDVVAFAVYYDVRCEGGFDFREVFFVFGEVEGKGG